MLFTELNGELHGMIHYHPALPSMYEDHLRIGFCWRGKSDRFAYRSPDSRLDKVGTLAFDCPEKALEYAKGAYAHSIEWVILAIEGEFDTYAITGNIPSGTVRIMGEIAPDQVSLYKAPSLAI